MCGCPIFDTLLLVYSYQCKDLKQLAVVSCCAAEAQFTAIALHLAHTFAFAVKRGEQLIVTSSC